jgi:hypothetical protein
MHLLGGPVDVAAFEADAADSSPARSRAGAGAAPGRADRVAELEATVAALGVRAGAVGGGRSASLRTRSRRARPTTLDRAVKFFDPGGPACTSGPTSS